MILNYSSFADNFHRRKGFVHNQYELVNHITNRILRRFVDLEDVKYEKKGSGVLPLPL